MEKSRLNTSPIDDKYWEVLEEYSYETSKEVIPFGLFTTIIPSKISIL